MKKAIKIIGLIFTIIIVLFLCLLAFLMVTEYRPKDVEEVAISGLSKDRIKEDKTYKILTWNIGYGGLDKDTDFFMDGGKMVLPISKEHVQKALEAISNSINKIDPDFVLLQEIDSDSKRTYNINEIGFFDKNLGGESTFAYNYKVAYVPFPWPTLGKVNSGIYTQSDYKIENSYRYAQPVPHKWPIKLANLKRGFNANYLPIDDSDKYLVLVNAHLDAYESGSNGRLAQIKQIIAFMNEEYKKGNYIIVGGDFNQELRKGYVADIPDNLWNPSPFPYDYLTDNLQVVFDKDTHTSRLNHKPYDPNDSYECIIDGFIVSENVRVEKVKGQNLGFINSDHNPVLFEFSLIKGDS